MISFHCDFMVFFKLSPGRGYNNESGPCIGIHNSRINEIAEDVLGKDISLFLTPFGNDLYRVFI